MFRGLVLTIALAAVACSPENPSVQSVLADDGEEQSLSDLKSAARSARTRADQRPADADAQVAAARALYVVADYEVRRGLIASLDRESASDVDELLARQSDLPDELKGPIGALGDAGAGYARAAIQLDSQRADARYFLAACLGFETLGKGATAALMQGLAPKLSAAIKDAIEADESFGAGAPLRARAAFYGRAPWPLGDKKIAHAAAERAASTGTNLANDLCVAENYWRSGKKDAAVIYWKRALDAPPGELSRANRYAREFARRAIALADS